ncbi:S25 ribosomal protein [Binucleata daphniae]
MVKKAPVSKAAQASKIQKTGGKEKKKWSKGKQKDTVKRAVAIDTALLARIQKDISNTSCVTKTYIAEKYNVNAGLAERLLSNFCEQGILKLVHTCSLLKIYSKNVKVEEKIEIEVNKQEEVSGWA